jgi:hypothetical protein
MRNLAKSGWVGKDFFGPVLDYVKGCNAAMNVRLVSVTLGGAIAVGAAIPAGSDGLGCIGSGGVRFARNNRLMASTPIGVVCRKCWALQPTN